VKVNIEIKSIEAEASPTSDRATLWERLQPRFLQTSVHRYRHPACSGDVQGKAPVDEEPQWAVAHEDSEFIGNAAMCIDWARRTIRRAF
jgi:hypothetical protein